MNISDFTSIRSKKLVIYMGIFIIFKYKHMFCGICIFLVYTRPTIQQKTTYSNLHVEQS